MGVIGQQIQELIETREDFVVLLNSEGFILHSNQHWISYCQKNRLSSALWKKGENYLSCLKEMKKFIEILCINAVLSEKVEEELQLELFSTSSTTDYLLVKHRLFSLDENAKGVILYKQPLNHSHGLNQLHVDGFHFTRHAMIEKGLTGNLNASGLYFTLQPQNNCITGELTGIEVLARWHHPTLGPISPVEFIAIAEETGTIGNLTNFILENVFSFIHNKAKHNGKAPKIAINVTPSLITSSLFFENLYELMEKHNILSERIELEITESIELIHSKTALNNLNACKAKGISITVDEFWNRLFHDEVFDRLSH